MGRASMYRHLSGFTLSSMKALVWMQWPSFLRRWRQVQELARWLRR